MTPAIRQTLQNVQDGDHAGLILSRYLVEQETGGGAKPSRDTLYTRARAATRSVKDLYEKSFERWKSVWQEQGEIRLVAIDRMIVGFGSDNVLEAGLTLHHTYGVPYIPGSAVKGLCAHYCNDLGGDFSEGGSLHKTVFGDTNQAGQIRFHDALIVPDSLNGCLKDDVLTPHHSDYYGSTDETAPTDFDAPVPVTFLSVSGTFLFVLSCDGRDESGKVPPAGKKWIKFVWKLLEGALTHKGIGGKTGSGYGFGFEVQETVVEQVKVPLKKGTIKELTRLTKKQAEAYHKTLLFVDDEDNKCIVLGREEKIIKERAPQAGDKIALAYDAEQTQGGNTFLLFRLPPE